MTHFNALFVTKTNMMFTQLLMQNPVRPKRTKGEKKVEEKRKQQKYILQLCFYSIEHSVRREKSETQLTSLSPPKHTYFARISVFVPHPRCPITFVCIFHLCQYRHNHQPLHLLHHTIWLSISMHQVNWILPMFLQYLPGINIQLS